MTDVKITTIDPMAIEDTHSHWYRDCDAEVLAKLTARMQAVGYDWNAPVIVECALRDVNDPAADEWLTVVSGCHRVQAAREAGVNVYAVVLGYEVMCAIEPYLGDVDKLQAVIYLLLRTGCDITAEAIVALLDN